MFTVSVGEIQKDLEFLLRPSLTVVALIFKNRLVVSPRSNVYLQFMGSFISERRTK